MFEYRATIIRVIDGDTIHADVDLGFDTHARFTLRLAGINSPENSTPEGQAATAYARELLPVGSVVTITTIKDRREKYGRYLAYITTADSTRVNDELIQKGYAVAYDGGAR